MNQFENLAIYIAENYYLNYTSSLLVRNILNYVELQGFTDNEDNIAALNFLLGEALFSKGVPLSAEEIREYAGKSF